MKRCTDCRMALRTWPEQRSGLPRDVLDHLDVCSDCRLFADSIALTVLTSPGGCPDGFDLSGFVEGTLTASAALEVAGHLAICAHCSLAVDEMHHLCDARTQTGRMVIWSQALDDLRHRIGEGIRGLLEGGLWLPAPAGAALRGEDGSGSETSAGAAPKAAAVVEVLDRAGNVLDGVSAIVLTPPFIDEEGTLFASLLVKQFDLSAAKQLFLCIDINDMGLLCIGPGELDGPFHVAEEVRFRVKFEEYGFSNMNVLVPVSGCCLLVD